MLDVFIDIVKVNVHVLERIFKSPLQIYTSSIRNHPRGSLQFAGHC